MTSPAPPPSPARFSPDWGAIAIVALAVAFRLYRIDTPFVDAHSWRQVTNVDIARLWAEGPIDFLYPSVSWGGPDGRVGLEFPLLHLFIALVWRVTGESVIGARLVPVAFSALAVWFTYRLSGRLFDAPAGRAAAFLMAVSPSFVYFGRTPLSDVPMVTFSIGAVLGFLAYAQDGRRRDALGGVLALALAGLVKVPAVLVLAPVVWTGLVSKGVRRTLSDPWYVSGTLAALGAIGLWYLHADRIYLETGLTQAIFRPSGTYPADIAQYAGPFTTVSHWTRPALLTWQTARDLADRYWALHLTPIFTVVTLLGLASWRWSLPRRSVVDLWMAAALALVGVSLAGQVPHEFHQLPTLPPLALYFGMAAGPLFGGAWYARLRPRRRVGTAAVVAAALVATAIVGFRDSGAIPHLYRPDNLNLDLMNAGWAIDQVTPKNALIVTVEYDRYGSNSPMLLYFARRRGWSFDATAITPTVTEYLRTRSHACYLAIADWPTLEALRPDMTAWLHTARAVELPYTHWRYRLYDLGCPAPPSLQ